MTKDWEGNSQEKVAREGGVKDHENFCSRIVDLNKQ